MEPKAARILQPCVVSSIEIGHVMTSLEAAKRMPPSPTQASVVATLKKHLEALGNEYSTNCLGTGHNKV